MAVASVILSLLGLLGSLLSFVAQLALARAFGTGPDIDSYYLANSLPLLVGGLLVGGMAYQIVPFLTHHDSSRLPRRDVEDGLIQLFAIAGGVIALLGVLVSLLTIRRLPHWNVFYAHSVVPLAALGWAGSWSALMTALLTAMCNVRKKFFIPAATGYFPSIFLLVVCLAGVGKLRIVEVGLAVALGQTAGTGLILWRMRRDLFPPRKAAHTFRYLLGEMNRLPLVLISMLVFVCYGTIDAYWASRLDTGTISVLGYGQRIIVALASVAVNGAGVVILPHLAEAAARGDRKGMLAEAARTIRCIMLLVTPIALIVGLLARPTVEALFLGGRFDSHACSQLALLLRYLLLGMIPMSCCTILFRGLYASRDLGWAAVIGALGALLYFFGAGAAVRWGIGLRGFGMAYVVGWTATAAFSARRLWRSNLAASLWANARWIFSYGVLAAFIACTCLLIAHSITGWASGSGIGRLARLVAVDGATFTLGLFAMYLLRFPEIRAMVAKLKRGFAPKGEPSSPDFAPPGLRPGDFRE